MQAHQMSIPLTLFSLLLCLLLLSMSSVVSSQHLEKVFDTSIDPNISVNINDSIRISTKVNSSGKNTEQVVWSVQYMVDHQLPQLELNVDPYVSGDRNLTLWIPPSQLIVNTTYSVVFRYGVQKNKKKPLVWEQRGPLIFRTGNPPRKPSVIVTPSKGTVDDVFQIEVQADSGDCGDNNAKCSFALSFEDKLAKMTVFLFSFDDPGSRSPNFTSLLPQGFSKDGRLTLTAHVRNLRGESSFSSTVVGVLPSVALAHGGGLPPTESITAGEGTEEFELNMINIVRRVDYIMLNDTLAHIYMDETKQLLNTIVNSTYKRFKNDQGGKKINQKLSLLRSVAQFSSLFSSDSKKDTLSMINTILQVDMTEQSQNSTVDTYISSINAIAATVSDMAPSSFGERILSNLTMTSVRSLERSIIRFSYPDGLKTALSTSSFSMAVRKVYDLKEDLMTQVDSSHTVQVPADIYSVVGSPTVSLAFTRYSSHINPYAWSNSTRNMTSSIIDVKIGDEDGTIIPVQNLAKPILITLEVNHEVDNYECRYWNDTVQDWKSDGCIFVSRTGLSVTCACTHTTSFAAFVLDEVKISGTKSNTSRYLVGIVFNSIYSIFCIVLIAILILTRRSQPVKSRFVAPYVGLTAILIDCTFQGIIRNSLRLSNQSWKVVDSFGYVIMLTANPLMITAMAVYVWQHVRHICMQHIYYLMCVPRGESGQLNMIRIFKIVCSKLVFVSIVGCVWLCSTMYFAIIIGPLKQNYPRTLMLTQVISYASIMLALALCLMSSIMADWLLAWKSGRLGLSNWEESVSESGAKKSTNAISSRYSVFNIVSDIDPLHFRRESIIICATMLVLLTTFCLGIGSTLKTGLEVVVIVFDLLLTLLSILAFGGYVVLSALYQKIYRSCGPASKHSLVSSDEGWTTLLSVLTNPFGHHLFAKFSQQEFALENVLLYDKLASLKTKRETMRTDERKEELLNLHKNFVDEKGYQSVNLDGPTKVRVRAVLEKSNVSRRFR